MTKNQRLLEWVEELRTLCEPTDVQWCDGSAQERAERVMGILSTLSPREEKIIRLRFGIGENAEYTLEEIGKRFNVSRERIRQIEKKALNRLRHSSRREKLKHFLD